MLNRSDKIVSILIKSDATHKRKFISPSNILAVTFN